jgi:hypothetical protein
LLTLFIPLLHPDQCTCDEAKFYLKLSDEEAQLITPNRNTGRTFDPMNATGNTTFIRWALTSPAMRLGQAEQQLTALQAKLESVQVLPKTVSSTSSGWTS